MGQTEVTETLKKHKHQWLNSGQVCSCVTSGKSAVQVCLKKLYDGGFIERKGDMHGKSHSGYLYKYKK